MRRTVWAVFLMLAVALLGASGVVNAEGVHAGKRAQSMSDGGMAADVGPTGTASSLTMGTSQQGIPYLAGGVGENLQDRMESRAGQYNLKLVFTLNEGNYIADVDVAIKDAKGNTVLQQNVPGPFLFAKLPAGSYTVSATFGGKTHTSKVNVGQRLHTAYMRWPSNPDTDFIPSYQTARQ